MEFPITYLGVHRDICNIGHVVKLYVDRVKPGIDNYLKSKFMESKKNKIYSYIKRCILFSLTIFFIHACNLEIWQPKINPQSQIIGSISSDTTTFNYALNESNHKIFDLIYQGLVRDNPITGEIESALAASWQFSEDKKQIIFTLRKDLKWSDGESLTVEDVVFTYNEIYLNKEIPTSYRDSLRIGETQALPTVKKIGDFQVEFSISEPFAPFLSNVDLPILPAHALQKSVRTKDSEGKLQFLYTWGTNTPPAQLIVNGPYLLESYIPGTQFIFRRNPYYWKKDKQGNHLPYIERIICAIIESKDTALLKFRSGELDYINVSPEYFSLLKHEEKRGRFTIYNSGIRYSVTFMSFNLNQGRRGEKPLVEPKKSRWFNNVRFRQAIAYAIDRKTIINNVYRGLGQELNSQIPVQSPYYLSLEKAGSKVYEYNPKQAKKLLLLARFKYNNRGQLLDVDNNAVRFTLLTNASDITQQAMAAQIKQYLSQIGIQLDFQPIVLNALINQVTNSLEWEAMLLSFNSSNEPNDDVSFWSPEQSFHLFNKKPQLDQPHLEGREVADWEKKIGQLYIQGARELNRDKRREIYAEVQQIIQEYLPAIFLVNPYSMLAVRNRFDRIQYSALEGIFWNIDELKIKKDFFKG